MTTTRKPGRPVDKELQERRRAEILDAAAKLFAEKGYAAADTQLMADRLKVAKGTIFRYFPTKRELFAASLKRSLEQLSAAVDAAVSAQSDPLEMIRAAVVAYLGFFDEHPEVVELFILERAEFRHRQSSYFEQRDKCDEQDDAWPKIFQSLVDAGRFREAPVERVRNVLGDLLYGTIFSNHMSGRTRSLKEQADDVFDIVFQGLFTEAERRRWNAGRN